MKKPEETNKWLRCLHCEDCPYDEHNYDNKKHRCVEVGRDALAYLKRLGDEKWNVFDLLSSAWFGKRCYFKQDDGTVYSRASGEYLSFDQALDEFAGKLTFDREGAPEPQVPKWISVEERLPESGRYMVITKKGDGMTKVNTATYNDMGWWTYANFGEITHWMPLPEPPKEG